MSKTRISRITIGFCASLLASLVHGQDDSRIAAEISEGIDLGASGARRFEANDLRVGDQFPAVEIFDETGNSFSTETLREKYTVLVNGCLT